MISTVRHKSESLLSNRTGLFIKTFVLLMTR